MSSYRGPCFSKTVVVVILSGLIIQRAAMITDASAEIVEADFVSDELPDTIKPREYDIDLKLNHNYKYVEGKVDIYVEIDRPKIMSAALDSLKRAFESKRVNPKANDGIALHLADNLSFRSENVEVRIGSSIEELRHEEGGEKMIIKRILRSSKAQLVMFRFEKSLPKAGSYARISISYDGPISPKMYEGELYDRSTERKYLYHAIHLEQGQVPQLFPCFEGPNFKAKISLTVQHPDLDRRVVANLPLEKEGTFLSAGPKYQRTKFRPSNDPMPVSSLVFAIVPADPKEAKVYRNEALDSSPTIDVLEPIGHSGQGKFAADCAIKTIQWFHKYLDTPPKYQLNYLNLVAMPPIAEWNITQGLNIALINHEFLLVDETMSSPEHKMETALNVALVVARHWFGSMLEPKEPSDLWITEGLALHLAIQAVDSFMPEFHVKHYFNSYIRPHGSWPRYGDSSYTIDESAGDPYLMASRYIRRLVRAEQVIQLLRANIVGSDNDGRKFNEIIRSLVSGDLLASGIDRSDLAREFADHTTKYSHKEIEVVVEGMMQYGLDSYFLVELLGDEVRFENHLDPKVSVWPVTMQVQFNRVDSQTAESLTFSYKVPISEFELGKKYVSVKIPTWFNAYDPDSSDWLRVVLGKGQLMPYNSINYAKNIVNRLGQAFRTNQLSVQERIDILTREIRTLKGLKSSDYHDRIGYSNQLDNVINLYQDELDPDVLLELLRTIKLGEKVCYCESKYGEQLKRIYKNLKGLSVSGHESPSLLRIKSRLATRLVQLDDSEVISEAVAIFDSVGVDKLDAFLREPVYKAVYQDEHTAEQRKRKDILNARELTTTLAEEKTRLANVYR